MALRSLLFGLAIHLTAAPVARACDIALVLAMDVSGSVDAYEYELQTRGVADALQDPAIRDALLRGRVALAVVQWSGALEQTVSIPWVRIDEPARIRQLSARIASMPRAFAGGNTAVGEAIDLSSELFTTVRDCAHWVIDVSGDGDENEGYTVGAARRAAWDRGITINGLAIEDAGASRSITNFYRSWVVTPGGFVITARQHTDFARAIREKLLRELIPPMAGPGPGRGPVPALESGHARLAGLR
ncbi:MAG: DUF1194 domain-containing protein [Rhodobacteraceae bacterium]|nr:DUF1194 domain-containing protein [Paracoccaceae bacterium]